MVVIVETIYGQAAAHILARMQGLDTAADLVRAYVRA
ncbi:MAG: hypothetical protein QOI16_1907, partial [Pseudonocardiales bacterium]|nr:hypothetical protein [Pseudonocardiales bacterium]